MNEQQEYPVPVEKGDQPDYRKILEAISEQTIDLNQFTEAGEPKE